MGIEGLTRWPSEDKGGEHVIFKHTVNVISGGGFLTCSCHGPGKCITTFVVVEPWHQSPTYRKTSPSMTTVLQEFSTNCSWELQKGPRWISFENNDGLLWGLYLFIYLFICYLFIYLFIYLLLLKHFVQRLGERL